MTKQKAEDVGLGVAAEGVWPAKRLDVNSAESELAGFTVGDDKEIESFLDGLSD